MNKEKVLALISEAMDRGASIRVHVTQMNTGMEWPWDKHTPEQAEDYINRFQEAVGGCPIELSSHNGIGSLTVDKENIHATFSYFPYMEEDIKFHEEEGDQSA